MNLSTLPLILDRVPVRLRLSLVHALWMAVIYTALGLGLYEVLDKNLNDSVNAALISSAKSIRDARYAWGLGGSLGSSSDDKLLDQYFGEPPPLNQLMGERLIKPYARIISVSGKVQSQTDNVIAALPVTPKAIDRAENGLSTLETFAFSETAPLRQFTLPIMLHGKFNGEIVQVGVFLTDTLETLKNTSLVLWLAIPVALGISIILGYLLTARALKPVTAITQAAARMGIYDLNIRLPLSAADDEIQELAKTFNHLFDRLEDAVKRLRRFTGDVSHELRTPLAVLRGEAELALRKKRDEATYEKALQVISKEAEHMTLIIEDLLLLARAESKAVAFHWTPVVASTFMLGLSEKVRPVYESRNVTLESRSGEVSSFSCAPAYLALALKNILINAAKHSAPGSKVFFTLAYSQPQAPSKQPQTVCFTIQDHGEGIPQAALANIFDPFFRVDSARNRANGGVGIGLSLALALIKMQGGAIIVSSEEGRGSTFHVSLPLQQPHP